MAGKSVVVGIEVVRDLREPGLVLILDKGVDAQDLLDFPRFVAREESETSQVSWSVGR